MRYVKGYGTFDPDLPEFLVEKDGKLYNKHATNNQNGLVEEWKPPEGWRGDGTLVRFIPEGEGEVWPAPQGSPGVNPLSNLLAALRAVVAHDRERLREAQRRAEVDAAREQEALRLSTAAADAFDKVLEHLAAKTNK